MPGGSERGGLCVTFEFLEVFFEWLVGFGWVGLVREEVGCWRGKGEGERGREERRGEKEEKEKE